MKKLTIKESKWLRGEPEISHLLIDEKMCCLGFLALQCGYTENQILLRTMPNRVDDCSLLPRELIKGNGFCTDLCYDIANINDHPSLPDEIRKNKLIELFKQMDYELEFVE